MPIIWSLHCKVQNFILKFLGDGSSAGTSNAPILVVGALIVLLLVALIAIVLIVFVVHRRRKHGVMDLTKGKGADSHFGNPIYQSEDGDICMNVAKSWWWEIS